MRFYIKNLLSIAALIVVCGCSRRNEGPNPPTDPNVMVIAKDSNQFAFDLYTKLSSEKDGNLFFSPQSISTALAMTYAGARGETADQMASVLHFELPTDQLHAAEASLINYWNALGKQSDVQLSIANRLWGQQGYKFLDSFTELLRKDYGAGLEQVDFSETEAARQTINKWVEGATAGKIADLIHSGVLDSLTRLVLTNAIYFKGDWKTAFDKDGTRPSEFHLTADKKIDDVPLMYQTETFRFGQAKFAGDQELNLLELPYKGEQLSMVVLLPEAVDGLGELEKHLTAESLRQWLDAARPQKVQVFLPKFKLTSEFRLRDALSSMGMTAAFDDTAYFSGMDGSKDLYLSAVVHKAFVDVNEEGTEAAAATSVKSRVKSAPPMLPTFRADHPFVFLIRENATGAILFVGRVMDPR